MLSVVYVLELFIDFINRKKPKTKHRVGELLSSLWRLLQKKSKYSNQCSKDINNRSKKVEMWEATWNTV